MPGALHQIGVQTVPHRRARWLRATPQLDRLALLDKPKETDHAPQVIKIGFTATNIEKRLATLKVASWEDLVLLLVTDGGEDTEAQLHTRFKHLHLRGEWFRMGEDLMAHIDLLRAEAEAGMREGADLSIEDL